MMVDEMPFIRSVEPGISETSLQMVGSATGKLTGRIDNRREEKRIPDLLPFSPIDMGARFEGKTNGVVSHAIAEQDRWIE